MGRFDEFAKSSARGAGLLGSLRRGTTVDADAGISRRDLIAKAGLVGGATLAASALVQSVSSPAFAANSTGCFDPNNNCGGPVCAKCPNGGMCATASDCASTFCSNQTCVAQDPIPNGSDCTGTTTSQRDFSCASEYCDDNGTCAPRLMGTVPNGSPCHGVTDYQASVQCTNAEVSTCYGWNPVTTSGTCRKKSGAPCSTVGQDATCGSGICSIGNKCA